MKSQKIAIVSLLLVAAGLAACSSTSKNSAGSTTEVPSSTTPDVVSSTETTATPATQPPATPAPTNPAPTGHNLYDQVNPPNVPSGHTDTFASSGVLGNGVYWVVYNGGETFTPDITVLQAYFGQECIDMATAAGDECLNGIFVPDPPSRDINDLPFSDDVLLTVSDFSTQLSYYITPDELRSVRASSPSAPAPPSFSFASFAFLMTVQDGHISKFEQVWTP